MRVTRTRARNAGGFTTGMKTGYVCLRVSELYITFMVYQKPGPSPTCLTAGTQFRGNKAQTGDTRSRALISQQRLTCDSL